MENIIDMKTTLNKIKDQVPCPEGWKILLRYLGKTKTDNNELSILTILESNGLDDALWCLRAVEGKDKEIRLYAIWCARQIQHLMTDQRSINALDVAERFVKGMATEVELKAARDAACSAVWSVARNSASYSSRSASYAATAACDTVSDVVSGSVWAAARDTRDAVWAAAMNVRDNYTRDDTTILEQTNKLIEICNE